MTAQGHPRRIFATAIERGNVVVAEATARELGLISLEDALALTALVAEKEPERGSRFAVRWLRRLLQEDAGPAGTTRIKRRGRAGGFCHAPCMPQA